MATSYTSTARGGTADPTKQIGYVAPQQPAPAQQPMAAASTGVTEYPVNGKVSGPYDRYRGQPPQGVSVAYWNDFLDQKNQEFPKLSGGDQQRLTKLMDAPKSDVGTQMASQATTGFRNLPAAERQKYSQADSAAAPGGYGDPNNPQGQQDQLVQQIINNRTAQAADNKQFVDTNVVPALNSQRQANDMATMLDQQAYGAQSNARDKLQGTLGGLSTEQRSNAANYNQQGTDLYNNYAQGQGALNTQDQATLGQYMNETNPLMTQLQSHGSNPNDIAQQQAALQAAIGVSNGSLNYSAAQAASNAQDVARQNQSYGVLSGIGGGSLDYNAAQYQSNPGDVANQMASYTDLQRAGKGSLDWKSQAAQAYADPNDLANQRKALSDIQGDVAGGNKDQLDALNLIKSRTGVAPTAQEQLLYELSRRRQGANEQSSREAVAERMAGQGIRSGAAAQAQNRAASMQNSEDALVSNLAANAGAVQRAQAYTGMQADQANAMRNSQQNALGLQGNLSTSMRNAGFSEAYQRGVGADTDSQANQGTRLSGMQGAANTANTMRGQSDTVGLTNAGYTNQARANNQSTRLTGNVQAGNMATNMRNASDSMSQFNTGQTNNARANNQATMLGGTQLQANQSNQIRNSNDAMSMFQDNYASQEATRVGNLAGDRQQAGLNTTNQVGTRNASTYQSGADQLNTNYGRDKDSIALDTGNALTGYGADTDVNNALRNMGSSAAGRAATYTGSAAGVAGTRAGTSQADNQALVDALTLSLGNNSLKSGKAAWQGH